jgi:hypothetical protein
MSFVKKLVFAALMIFSLNAFSQGYEYPVLKAGVKNDIVTLIADSDNFVGETEYHFNENIAYLKHTNYTVSVFNKYGTTSGEIYHPKCYNYDQPYISSTEELLSVGNGSKAYSGEGECQVYIEYFQCVQFAQAISNAGTATGRWKEPEGDPNIDQNTDVSWKLIAKFGPDGYYNGSINGHVALAIGSNYKGVYVIDQNWEGSRTADYGKIGIHIIPWSEATNYGLVTIPSN